MRATEDLMRAFTFCREIGLEVEWRPGASGFLKGVEISGGKLLVSPDAEPSNLLHEAGHLAVLPALARRAVCGNVDDGLAAFFDAGMSEPVDSPFSRALMQSSDTEATAWAWAAGQALGLEARNIIRNEDYDGEGESVRAMLAARCYLGINGLFHAGMCKLRGEGAYPEMVHWLQPAVPFKPVV